MELPILKFPKQILVDVDYLLGPIKSTIQGLGITSCSFVCSLWIVSGKQTQLHNEFKNNPKPSLGGLLFSENQTKWEWIWEDWGGGRRGQEGAGRSCKDWREGELCLESIKWKKNLHSIKKLKVTQRRKVLKPFLLTRPNTFKLPRKL